MARKPNDKQIPEDHQENPETAKQEDGQKAVKGLSPANPFNEPIDDTYPEGTQAEITQATLKPAETIVEHPLSPTDTNPNPHGNRDEPFTAVYTKEDGRSAPEEGDVEIEGTEENPVHLGDGRTLGKGQRAKVTKDLLKDENLKGKFKRV